MSPEVTETGDIDPQALEIAHRIAFFRHTGKPSTRMLPGTVPGPSRELHSLSIPINSITFALRRISLIATAALLLAAGALVAGITFASAPSAPSAPADRAPKAPRPQLPPAPRTVDAVVRSIGTLARDRFRPVCLRKQIPWPPARLVLLAFKRERLLEVWGANTTGQFGRIATYKILAASGHLGPKRQEGDNQVPEGFYGLPELNPNSNFHLSIRVDYPNSDDIRNSSLAPGAMGGDIYIHGNAVSIGCLALGDNAIEELFPLVAQVPTANRRIVISPFDFRRHPTAAYPKESRWVHTVYDRIRRELKSYPIGK